MRRVILVLGLLAGAAAPVPADEVLDERGFNPTRVTFGGLPYEHVDPLTGNLLLTFTDLTLPGNGGFDLRIQRTYNSKVHANFQQLGTKLGEDSWAGLGWRIHFGRLLNATAAVPGPIEMPDGSQHKLFNHVSSPGVFVTRDYWVYDPVQKQLKLPNGITYTLGQLATINDGVASVVVRYTTLIRDPFGNTITLEYVPGGPPDALSRIVQDLGGGQQRTVTFQTDASTRKALSKMTYASGAKTYVWTYAHDPVDAAYSLLESVAAPEGQKWQFAYDTSGTSASKPYELKALTTPNGGRVGYTYATEQASFKVGNYVNFRAVKTRTLSGPGLTTAAWSYEWRLSTTASGYSTETSPCGDKTKYSFDITGSAGAWRIGSLLRKTVTESNGAELEDQTFEWQPSVAISLDADTRRVGTLTWGDPDVFVPLLKASTLRRDRGETYRTEYEYRTTSLNDFGRAWRISATGDAGTRTTERTFAYGFTPYIRDKVSSEKLTVWPGRSSMSRSFSRSWLYNLANGFRTDSYGWGRTPTSGLRTRFGATSDGRGNLGSVTDGNGHTSTYAYTWGVLSRVVKPAHPTVDTLRRTINADGTIAAETRYVGGTRNIDQATTSFEYDLLMRPVRTTPPVGLPILTRYDAYALSTPGKVTVTRGVGALQSRTVTTLDGLGRPTQTENSLDVKTTTRYDSCGRRSYQSYPYTGSTHEGVGYEYDGLGRLTRRTNTADDTFSTIDYAGLDVTLTDENGYVTARHWVGFAGPEDGRLASVTAGLGSPEANTTSYAYDALGQLEKVTHPGGLERRFEYSAENGLLEKETHPESGSVSFQYDDAGNRVFRSNNPYAWTSFEYDENNRLIEVVRHGSDLAWRSYGASYRYDPSDNKTLAANAYVSSEFTYDAGGRPTSRVDAVRPTGEGQAVASFETSWWYDDHDNLEQVRYPRSVDGRTGDPLRVWYSHDTEGRITSVGTQADRGSFASDFTYHPSGVLEGFTSGNGLRHQVTLDARQRILSIESGGVLSLTYGYEGDGVGNPTSIGDALRPEMGQGFDYDALGRLRSATGVWGDASFGYDALGNRISSTIGGSATAYTIDPATNRLASTSGAEARSFSYDPLGNTIADDVNTYTYTPDNQVSAATTANGTFTYRYDADMQRKMTLSGGPNRYFVHGPGNMLLSEFEEPSPGELRAVRSHVYAGGRLLAFVRPENAVSLQVAAAAEAQEEAGSHAVAVTLVTSDGLPTQREVLLAFATADRTAVAGRDYAASSGSLVFPRGAANGTTKLVPVTILDDSLDEDDETLEVQFSGVVGAALGNAIQVVTLLDGRDPAPAVVVSPVEGSVSEGDVGMAEAGFTISLSAPAGRAITVSYAAESGTAVAGLDFLAVSGSVSFDPEATAPQTVWVPIIGDTLVEPDEDLFVRVTEASNAGVGERGRVVVTNDDGPRPVSPAGFDLNGDGRADLLWHDQESGDLEAWLMGGTARVATARLTPSPTDPSAWQVRGVADFDADGRNDVLWQEQASGALQAWLMDGTTQTAVVDLAPATPEDAEWRVSGLADLDHDGSTDVLWRHVSSGELRVWLMEGAVRTASLALEPRTAPGPTWQVRALADFDADSQVDVLWHDQASGALQVWFLAGTTATRASPLDPGGSPDTGWQVRLAADFDADGKPDLLWRHDTTGELQVWFLDGTRVTGTSSLDPSRFDPSSWQITPR